DPASAADSAYMTRIATTQVSGPGVPGNLPGPGATSPALVPLASVVPLGGDLLANDSDEDGDPLTVSLVSGPGHGSLVLNQTGSFVYTPAAGFAGQDWFSYVVCDGYTTSAEATVTLDVVNQAPQVRTESYTVSRNGLLSVPRRQDG